MKKKILSVFLVALTLASLICAFSFAAGAEGEAPTVTIDKFNLVFADNVYLKYAVKFEGVEDSKITSDNIGMLYFTEAQDDYTKGGEAYSSAVVGQTTISGTKYYTFEYRNLTAKQMTDYIYSVAYIDLDGERYFSAPVKYSVLDYAYSKLGKTGTASDNDDLKNMLASMLEYGANAQKYFKYNLERLANEEYYLVEVVGGTLADGFTKGLYKNGDSAILTAPEKDGYTFAGWQNTAGEIVKTENPATIDSFAQNETYTAVYEEAVKYSEGLQFTSNGDGTCYVAGIGTCTDTDIVIPPVSPAGDMVTSIGSSAFKNCKSFDSVTIPDSVESIRNRAFYYCQFTRITMGDNITRIGNEAFYCSKLVSITIGDSVTSIGSSAFYHCTNLEQITIDENNPSYKNIDGNHIYSKDGKSLIQYAIGNKATNFTTPNGVEQINKQAFAKSKNLINVTIGDSVTKIGVEAFDNSSLMSVEIGDGVIDIYEDAFRSCAYLVNMTIGKSVTNICNHDFIYFPKLEQITIDENNPNYKNIDGNHIYSKDGKRLLVYAGKNKATSFTIPDSVTSIGEHAFFECNNLASVIISNSVETINDYALSQCRNLTSVLLGCCVTSIGTRAFAANSKLVEIINKSNLDIANLYLDINSNVKIHSSDSIIVNVQDYLFINQNNETYLLGYVGNDTQLVLPQDFNGKSYKIYEGAFNYNLTIESITIPYGITELSDVAFYHCTNLKAILIPESVKRIGTGAFSYCSNLTNIYYYGILHSGSLMIPTGSNNTEFHSATIYGYSETEPTDDGNYWHYVDGVPTPWKND